MQVLAWKARFGYRGSIRENAPFVSAEPKALSEQVAEESRGVVDGHLLEAH